MIRKATIWGSSAPAPWSRSVGCSRLRIASPARTKQKARDARGPPEKIDIYAGSNDFKGGTRIKVKRVIRHADYNPENMDNDIALLELSASAPLQRDLDDRAHHAAQREPRSAASARR